MGELVRCYSCGRRYKPTEEGTRQHTSHATTTTPQMVPWEQLLKWLDECQTERDQAIRDR